MPFPITVNGTQYASTGSDYGCADSYVGLAFTTADEVVDYIKAHDQTSDADRELGLR